MSTILLFLARAPAGFAEGLLAPTLLEADGRPIDVERNGHSAPFAADFDGDGVRDLLLGQYHDGGLRIYRNQGTNAAPRFDEFTWFRAGGSLGNVPVDCCIGFTPQLVDFDGDGRKDLLSGSWPGEIYLFRRQTDGLFAPGEPVKGRDGEPPDVGQAAAAFAADWDADGDLDLVVGNLSGEVRLVPNEGSARHPAYGTPRRLAAGGASIEVSEGNTGPVVADWDADGKPDLIVGTGSGSVLWYRNTGPASAPRLAAPEPLVGPSPVGLAHDARRKPGGWGLLTKVSVVDWNGDGRLDLLVGDRCGDYHARPTQTPEERAEEERAVKALPDLMRRWSAAFRDFRALKQSPEPTSLSSRTTHDRQLAAARGSLLGLKGEIARAQQVQELYQAQSQSHGFVWLFLRRPVEGP